MKTKRLNFRINERTWQLVEKVSKYLDMDVSSVLRNSLRYGLNSLLKFETSGTMDIKKLATFDGAKEASVKVDQEEYKPKPLTEEQKRLIEIANTKWLTDEND